MFRCISELKGLIIDTDSFTDESISEWEELFKSYACIFLTSVPQTKAELIDHYGINAVLFINENDMVFAPNAEIHAKVLKASGLKTTEIAYVSKDIFFISRTLQFLCGSIYISKGISYEEASTAADLICSGISQLQQYLKNGIDGFLGEKTFYPSAPDHGVIIPVQFEADYRQYKMFMLGRYFGYSHFMSNLHPYSSAIFLNKKEGKAYGVFDNKFYELLRRTIGVLKKYYSIDGICAVPPKPEEKNRFKKIIGKLANDYDLEDLTEEFICIKKYKPQKKLSYIEREQNAAGAFKMQKIIAGKNVLLIDDISTSGATLKSCIRALKLKGAAQIYILVFAVSQMSGVYWSSNTAEVNCPNCGSKMKLLINSQDTSFFYSCNNHSCNHTIQFDEGRSILEMMVANEEFESNKDTDTEQFN